MVISLVTLLDLLHILSFWPEVHKIPLVILCLGQFHLRFLDFHTMLDCCLKQEMKPIKETETFSTTQIYSDILIYWSDILEKLAESIFRYTAYPTHVHILTVVQKYPCLKEPGSFLGMYGWQQSLKYKMGNYPSKIRNQNIACPGLQVKNSR